MGIQVEFNSVVSSADCENLVAHWAVGKISDNQEFFLQQILLKMSFSKKSIADKLDFFFKKILDVFLDFLKLRQNFHCV